MVCSEVTHCTWALDCFVKTSLFYLFLLLILLDFFLWDFIIKEIPKKFLGG